MKKRLKLERQPKALSMLSTTANLNLESDPEKAET